MINDKIGASSQTNMSPKHYITSNVTNNKNELSKTVRLTSFQNPTTACNPFQSSLSLSILASLCIFCVIYTVFELFERIFLCSTQFVGGSHGLNFDKFRETAPLILCAVSREHDRSLRDFKPYNFTVRWSSSNLLIRKSQAKSPLGVLLHG